MTTPRKLLTLATLCLCAFAVNVDVTLVNITLPRLSVDLGAGTTELQWIVGAYTLVFASLVLTMGSLSDRYGRRGALILGLVIYGAGNGLAAQVTTAEALIATRAIMGVGAAIIFPTTLSIISNVFTDRRERAQAIGLWGASTGLAVAAGPIVGGALLESFSWHATFLAKVPLALGAITLVALFVPTSRDPEAERLDVPGILLSVAAVALVVFALIEAPTEGWLSAATLGVGTLGLALGAAFVAWERRSPHPMLDVRLFANPRFSGASVSIAVSFFALAGFIFLIVQYFQFLKGWGPLETGLRTLPVAISIAIFSILGTTLAVRRGTKIVVAAGLVSMGTMFAWVGLRASPGMSYLEIAAQMVLLGGGMGLTTAPATESIMGSVSTARAGVGSALNDMMRELGSTLGVAVVGSVFASVYAAKLVGPGTAGVPAGALAAAKDSVAAGLGAAESLAGAGATGAAQSLRSLTSDGFFGGMHAGCFVVAGLCLAGAVFCAIVLPAQPPAAQESEEPAVALPSPVLATAPGQA